MRSFVLFVALLCVSLLCSGPAEGCCKGSAARRSRGGSCACGPTCGCSMNCQVGNANCWRTTTKTKTVVRSSSTAARGGCPDGKCPT